MTTCISSRQTVSYQWEELIETNLRQIKQLVRAYMVLSSQTQMEIECLATIVLTNVETQSWTVVSGLSAFSLNCIDITFPSGSRHKSQLIYISDFGKTCWYGINDK